MDSGQQWLATPLRFSGRVKTDARRGRIDGMLVSSDLVESIRRSVERVLNTSVGGMPQQPDYGSKLADLRFRPVAGADRDKIETWVKDCFPRWDWRVEQATVVDVQYGLDPDLGRNALVRVIVRAQLSPKLDLPASLREVDVPLFFLTYEKKAKS